MTRDLTDRQFLKALKRNRFGRPILFWCEDKQFPGTSYSMLIRADGKIMKRETIAHLLYKRKCEQKARAAIAAEKVAA